MKKTLKATVLSLGMTAMFASGLAAAPTIQEITAYMRPDIKIVVDGKVQTMNSWDGTSVIPISYNGTTYLPMRALGDALNKNVTWDNQSQTVYLGASTLQETLVKDAEKQIGAFGGKIAALTDEISKLIPAKETASRIQQYLTYSGKLDTLTHEVGILSDQLKQNFKNGKLTYAVYSGYADSLDKFNTHLSQSEAQLMSKTISQGDVIQVKPGTGNQDPLTLAGIDNQLQTLNTQAETLSKEMQALTNATDTEQSKSQFRTLAGKLDRLECQADTLDEQLEEAYKKGQLTQEVYRAKEAALEKLDQLLDKLDDQLEKKLDLDLDKDQKEDDLDD